MCVFLCVSRRIGQHGKGEACLEMKSRSFMKKNIICLLVVFLLEEGREEVVCGVVVLPSFTSWFVEESGRARLG